MHICIRKLVIIGSDNALSHGWCQAIIWANGEILLIGPLGTNVSKIWIRIHTFWFKKMHLKISSSKWCPRCLSRKNTGSIKYGTQTWSSYPLRDNSQDLHCGNPSRSRIRLSYMNGQTFYTIPHLNHIYLCRTANMPWRTCVVVKQMQSDSNSIGHHTAFGWLSI